MRPLRIVHILEKNRFDTGSVHQMFQAAAGLQERGHSVTIVSRPGEELAARAGAAGVRLMALPLRSELDLRSVRKLAELFRNDSTDVIHVHKGLPHTLALAASWTRPVGAFVVNRGVSFDLTVWNRPKYRTPRVDRIVTVCEDIRQTIIRSGKVSPEKVLVVYAGTDVREFAPGRFARSDFRAEIGVPDELFLFATVGIRDWKGWRQVIDGVAELRAGAVAAGVLLIGCKSDDVRASVLSYARDRGIDGSAWAVESRRDMPRVLSAADCVVDASWAGTGITGTIREGMALERAVIATDCGGNRELVDGGVGWLIPARDQEALVGAMRDVAGERGLARERASAARQRVVDGFSREVRLDRLEQLYRSVLATKKQS